MPATEERERRRSSELPPSFPPPPVFGRPGAAAGGRAACSAAAAAAAAAAPDPAAVAWEESGAKEAASEEEEEEEVAAGKVLLAAAAAAARVGSRRHSLAPLSERLRSLLDFFRLLAPEARGLVFALSLSWEIQGEEKERKRVSARKRENSRKVSVALKLSMLPSISKNYFILSPSLPSSRRQLAHRETARTVFSPGRLSSAPKRSV